MALHFRPRSGYESDPQDLDLSRAQEKRMKQRARLRPNERKRYINAYTTKQCDITGDELRRYSGHVHHIRPVHALGDKNIQNLSYLNSDVHDKLHSTARQIAQSTGRPEYEVVEELSKVAIQLGKMARVQQGENPQKVYKRELAIDRINKMPKQKSFDIEGQLEG